MKRPPAIFAAILLLLSFAANFAVAEFRAGQPSRFLFGGYRGAAMFAGLAIALFLFPRVFRWIVGAFLVLVDLVLVSSLFSAFTLRACTTGIVVAIVAAWLFAAKFPAKPPRLPPSKA